MHFAARARLTAMLPVRVLTALYPNYTHVVTLEQKRISSIKDLAGRTVAIGIKGSGTHDTALPSSRQQVLVRTMTSRRYLWRRSKSPPALKDGRIDAYVFTGGIPANPSMISPELRALISLVNHGNLLPGCKYGADYRSRISGNLLA